MSLSAMGAAHSDMLGTIGQRRDERAPTKSLQMAPDVPQAAEFRLLEPQVRTTQSDCCDPRRSTRADWHSRGRGFEPHRLHRETEQLRAGMPEADRCWTAKRPYKIPTPLASSTRVDVHGTQGCIRCIVGWDRYIAWGTRNHRTDPGVFRVRVYKGRDPLTGNP